MQPVNLPLLSLSSRTTNQQVPNPPNLQGLLHSEPSPMRDSACMQGPWGLGCEKQVLPLPLVWLGRQAGTQPYS